MLAHHQAELLTTRLDLLTIKLGLPTAKPALLTTALGLQEFASANGAREAEFKAAETALQQGVSERELDERVQICLNNLDK